MDNLSLNNEALKQNLDELEYLNGWFGSANLLINALDKLYKECPGKFKNKDIVLGDIGCGGGDLLRKMSQWAVSKGLTIKLIGIDANPFMIQYAVKKSTLYPSINYEVLDIFSSKFQQLQFDIITANSILHHFSDASLVLLLKQLVKQTRIAIIVNDLQRHWISYVTIKWLAKLLKFSYFAKNDGTLSVLRAFQKKELINLLCLSAINKYHIRWRWAFRWEIIIWLDN